MLTVIICISLFTIIFAGVAIAATKPALFSWTSAGIAVLSGVCVGLIGPVSYDIAQSKSQADAIGGYHQFLNGSIVATDSTTYTCRRDGDCVHTYNCDPYIVMVPVTRYRTVPDGKGGTTQEPYIELVPETRYHYCPEATQEFTYRVTDSLGRGHTIASHIFAAQPQEWRRGEGLSRGVARGAPPLWTQMKAGVEQGNLYPVTLPSTYENYILADQHTILRQHSDDIKQLEKLKLLPDHTQNLRNPIYDGFSADKVSFVGFQPSNTKTWQRTLMYFNAALGMTLQGDLHVVAIKASAIPSNLDPHQYLLALKAYWLNDLGKRALPKNGIMLVLGVDDTGTTVTWSEAATGMPVGNGSMLAALSDLADTPFTTDALFGTTTARVTTDGGKTKAAYSVGSGKVASIITQEYPFARACMKCDDKEDKGQGFTYLSTDLPASSTIAS